MTSTPSPALHVRVFGIANPDVPGPALINNYRASLVASLTTDLEHPVIGLARDAFSIATVDGPSDHTGTSSSMVIADAAEPSPGTYVLTLGPASGHGLVRGSYALLLNVTNGHESLAQATRALVRLDV